jgi:hypothetical protein
MKIDCGRTPIFLSKQPDNRVLIAQATSYIRLSAIEAHQLIAALQELID